MSEIRINICVILSTIALLIIIGVISIALCKKLEDIDVTPVIRDRWAIHSRWIKTADGAECEKCGREAVYQIIDDHWQYEPYCPHCGAKMDGGE